MDLSHLMSGKDEAQGTKAVMTEFKDSLRVVEITFTVPGERNLGFLPRMDQLLALAKAAFPGIPWGDLLIDVGETKRRCGSMVNTIYISEFHGFKYHIHREHFPVEGVD